MALSQRADNSLYMHESDVDIDDYGSEVSLGREVGFVLLLIFKQGVSCFPQLSPQSMFLENPYPFLKAPT